MKRIFVAVFLLLSAASFAQSSNNPYKPIDDYVRSLGALDTLNIGTISYVVTKKFPDAKDKARAIFVWITDNISFNCKAARNSDNSKTNSDEVLKARKATSGGYAALFQDMCSVVKIRCLTVDGYIKNSTEQIDEKPEELNHTWAVVQLGQSPESWYYVDPTLGSGFTDDKMTAFTKSFNDAYFFADKKMFNFQHYADNSAWQLGASPKSLKEFISLPVLKNAAFEFGINSFTPATGKFKSKLKKPVQFSFKVNNDAKIEIVALAIGEGKNKKLKTVDHTFSNGTISFTYKFEEDDSFPVTLYINNKPVLGYIAEISE